MSLGKVLENFSLGLTLQDFNPCTSWEADGSYYTKCPFHNKYEKDHFTDTDTDYVPNTEVYNNEKKTLWVLSHTEECNKAQEIPARMYLLPLSKKDIFIIDPNTEKRFFNESRVIGSLKGCLLTISSPIIQPITSTIAIAIRTLRIALSVLMTVILMPLAPFDKKAANYFKFGLYLITHDVLKIITTPVMLALLELSALYTIVNSRDGKKLYSSFEKLIYDGKSILSYGFQPINDKDLKSIDPYSS